MKTLIPAHELVAKALRKYAMYMIENQDKVSVEDAKELDRALRSCKGIGDIDIVWPRWSYCCESNGWLTEDELTLTKTGYRYLKDNNENIRS